MALLCCCFGQRCVTNSGLAQAHGAPSIKLPSQKVSAPMPVPSKPCLNVGLRFQCKLSGGFATEHPFTGRLCLRSVHRPSGHGVEVKKGALFACLGFGYVSKSGDQFLWVSPKANHKRGTAKTPYHKPVSTDGFLCR